MAPASFYIQSRKTETSQDILYEVPRLKLPTSTIAEFDSGLSKEDWVLYRLPRLVRDDLDVVVPSSS